MNVEHLRRSLKTTWLCYYRDNRDWLVRLGVWVNYDGQRRPSSSFILATLATLEPQFTQLLPLVVDLTSNPDRIVTALGLNFSPDDELERLPESEREAVRMLPGGDRAIDRAITHPASRIPASIDESCQGVRVQEEEEVEEART